MSEVYRSLGHDGNGVAVIKDFAIKTELQSVQEEIHDPQKVSWRDQHDIFENKRGRVIQNHDVFALKLYTGDKEPLSRLPKSLVVAQRVITFVQGLSGRYPILENWQPNELSFQRYDDGEVGLSFHRDNLRFTGLVAILGLEGECELQVLDDEDVIAYDVAPGDLTLLRAPELIPTYEGDQRPEHGVYNLKTATRTSMMLRHNSRPQEELMGFEYDNWP